VPDIDGLLPLLRARIKRLSVDRHRLAEAVHALSVEASAGGVSGKVDGLLVAGERTGVGGTDGTAVLELDTLMLALFYQGRAVLLSLEQAQVAGLHQVECLLLRPTLEQGQVSRGLGRQVQVALDGEAQFLSCFRAAQLEVVRFVLIVHWALVRTRCQRHRLLFGKQNGSGSPCSLRLGLDLLDFLMAGVKG